MKKGPRICARASSWVGNNNSGLNACGSVDLTPIGLLDAIPLVKEAAFAFFGIKIVVLVKHDTVAGIMLETKLGALVRMNHAVADVR